MTEYANRSEVNECPKMTTTISSHQKRLPAQTQPVAETSIVAKMYPTNDKVNSGYDSSPFICNPLNQLKGSLQQVYEFIKSSLIPAR